MISTSRFVISVIVLSTIYNEVFGKAMGYSNQISTKFIFVQVLLFDSFYLSFKNLVTLTPQAGVIDKLNRLGRTLSVDMDMLKIFAIKLPV